MNIKRILSLLLVLGLLMSLLCLPVGAAERDDGLSGSLSAALLEAPQVNCKGVCLMDRNTGRVLFQQNGDSKVHPASTTKIMTALLCLKYGNLDDTVTVYSSDLASLIGANASSAGFSAGERLSLRSALKGLLVVSGCDAANVIARYVGGSISEFVNMMNQEAAALGCTGTHFTSPHGLHNDNQYTTPHDMAMITAVAMEYQEFRDIVGSYYVSLPATNVHGARTLTNTNTLLPGSSSYYRYSACIGVKTGTTTPASPRNPVREEKAPVLSPITSNPALQNAETEWNTLIQMPRAP